MSTIPFGSFAQGQNINKENQNVQQLQGIKSNILQSGRKAPFGDLKNKQGQSGFGKNLKTENENTKKSTLFSDIHNNKTFKLKAHLSKTETKKKVTSTIAEAKITSKSTNLPMKRTVLTDYEAFMFEKSQKLKNLEYVQASKQVLNDSQINNIIFANISRHEDNLRKIDFKQNIANDLPDIRLTTKVYEDSDDEDSLPQFDRISLLD